MRPMQGLLIRALRVLAHTPQTPQNITPVSLRCNWCVGCGAPAVMFPGFPEQEVCSHAILLPVDRPQHVEQWSLCSN